MIKQQIKTDRSIATLSCGFTLVEVMTAMLIFASAMGSLYLSFRTGMMAYRESEERATLFREGRRAINYMAEELRCAFIAPENEHIKFSFSKINLENEAVGRLTFFTLAHPFDPERVTGAPLYRVEYFLKPVKETGTAELRCSRSRMINENVVGEVEECTVASRVGRFSLRFLSGKGAWEKTWDSSDEMPAAVEITLLLAQQDIKGMLMKKEFLLTVNIPCGGEKKNSG